MTANSDHIARLEELAKSQGRLMDSNSVTRSDEVATARRRYQYITGPSGIDELKRTLMEGSENCWRSRSSERHQAVLTCKYLEEGLQKLRKEGWKQRRAMRSRVGDTKYWRIVEEIRRRAVKIRSKERKRLRRKEENIRRRETDCERHQLCRWIKRFHEEMKNDDAKNKNDVKDCCIDDN